MDVLVPVDMAGRAPEMRFESVKLAVQFRIDLSPDPTDR